MKLKGFQNSHLPCLNFDDVIIEPKVSNFHPDEVDISTSMISGLKTNLPIMSAHMPSISNPELISSISEMGGLGTLHDEIKLEDIDLFISKIKAIKINKKKYPNASMTNSETPIIIIACSAFDMKKAEYLLSHNDVNYVILNNVQPLHTQIIKNVRILSKKYPQRIILGNIVNEEGAKTFAKMPLAAVKVGLGPGSICTTGIISGCGMSQFTAIFEVSKVAKANNMKVIADGGIRNSGDIVKALAAGADGVMLGKLFAGCHEASGKIVEIDGQKYKQYEGARYNTIEIPDKTGIDKIDNFLTPDIRANFRVEGVSGLVPYIGPAHLLLYILSKGIRLTFGFIGAKNIIEFQKKVTLRYISSNSYKELNSNIPIRATHSFI